MSYDSVLLTIITLFSFLEFVVCYKTNKKHFKSLFRSMMKKPRKTKTKAKPKLKLVWPLKAANGN